MDNPEEILKNIVNQHGISILTQPRLKGLIMDLMTNTEKRHLNVLKRAIEERIGYKILEMMDDEPEIRQIKINTMKLKFKADNAFDDTADFIVDCFLNVLGWGVNGSSKPVDSNTLPFTPELFKYLDLCNQLSINLGKALGINVTISIERNGKYRVSDETLIEINKALFE